MTRDYRTIAEAMLNLGDPFYTDKMLDEAERLLREWDEGCCGGGGPGDLKVRRASAPDWEGTCWHTHKHKPPAPMDILVMLPDGTMGIQPYPDKAFGWCCGIIEAPGQDLSGAKWAP